MGAINEILPKATGVGKVDPNSDGTGEIFNRYEGDNANVATGTYSHAEGGSTTASGIYSHAEGYCTEAFKSAEHAEGRYNKSYQSISAPIQVIHSVGIGTSEDNRKNAHEIKFNGDHYIYGLGNFDGTNSAEAQTLQEVINSKQATITAGTGLEFEGNTLNVTLDTTVFKVVSVLPDSPAAGDENKIHLVPGASTGANNAYTEYAWVNSAWEILGEYTSEVDLTPYLKSSDAESTYLKITNAESEYATKTELAGKQNSTDDTLETTSKNIVGAINELASKPTGVGKVDPNSDGTGEIFNCYESDSDNFIDANQATGRFAHAEGRDTVASGDRSHAEGRGARATGLTSHAEGDGTRASGDTSHAEGFSTTAAGDFSHAEGYYSYAYGDYSHAEGMQTTASGRYSHAEGWHTEASGTHAHAEGDYTQASGNYSHTEGDSTQTFSDAEHAEGQYNKSYTSKDDSVRVIHSVGIGPSNSNRKNAHEIKFNGDHYIYGLGGYDGTNATDISVKTLQRIIEEILINTQQPVIDYSAPDSAFTGTTLINSEGISAVNVWNVENYSRTDIFLLNSSGTTTDKIRYDVVRDTQYQDFQTAHEGDNMEFDEIIQLSTIVTNSFAESDLFIYHARINDEPEAKYYLVDIVMTE